MSNSRQKTHVVEHADNIVEREQGRPEEGLALGMSDSSEFDYRGLAMT